VTQSAPVSRGIRLLRLTALAIIVVGALGIWGAGNINEPGGYSPVGPRVFPYAVSIALVVFGLLFLARATIWPDAGLLADVERDEAGTHWPTPLLLMAAIAAYAFLLAWLGYILATALFMPVSSRLLGSTNLRRDAIAGVALGTVLYVGFTQFLGVRLPVGALFEAVGLG
jgi:putative tricarboxylic transport membrane protein